ncbi:alpha/beta hydrolase [Ectobacillus funiculus]|uniref:alpha/beta hydrolase n=1 Tax=Ectobacillus funiculus TaxID=137993 RepID=UPI001FE4C9FE|nr:alpha/beta hydrolase [Ectobacillus funiculus]
MDAEMETAFTVQASDGVELSCIKWIDETRQPRMILQISHGMAEHIRRYAAFAQMLIGEGIFVYGNDHRGHGYTAEKKEDRGYFADENGFGKVVEDLYLVTQQIKKEYPGTPVVLFGHSMGSFLIRRYAQLYGRELHGMILSGTGDNAIPLLKIGKLLARLEMKAKGRKTPSLFLNNLSFGKFNKPFRPTRTPFDWLTRNEKEVDKYIADPLCGGIFTGRFFYDLYTGSEMIQKAENIAKVPKDLPILFISGDKDPVGGNTKGVLQAYEAFRAAGVHDVSYIFYKDGRHEMLHEINQKEVYSDIVRWLEER